MDLHLYIRTTDSWTIRKNIASGCGWLARRHKKVKYTQDRLAVYIQSHFE